MKNSRLSMIFMATTRISLGFLLFWAFLDKTFGFGLMTTAENAWINGASPTYGFLAFGAKGPFMEIFQAMAGNIVVDILFMLGLCLIGLSLMLGIGMKIAGYSGALMMILMWLAVLFPAGNPILDEHLIYASTMLWLAHANAGDAFGFGKKWGSLKLVKKFGWLK